jgi:4-hydroxy-3-polyprenylbenzoate decarboxylase
VDWETDLHFQTCTTMDTLDYSGTGLNEGSKVVIAAAGPKRRTLPTDVPSDLALPDSFGLPWVCLPGVLAVEAPQYSAAADGDAPADVEQFCDFFPADSPLHAFPLVVLVDDSGFTARTVNNFLWVTFTRSNPAADINGMGAFTHHKHWGCTGPLVIDARLKPHHAPPLEEDPKIVRRVEALGAPGGPLYRII